MLGIIPLIINSLVGIFTAVAAGTEAASSFIRIPSVGGVGSAKIAAAVQDVEAELGPSPLDQSVAAAKQGGVGDGINVAAAAIIKDAGVDPNDVIEGGDTKKSKEAGKVPPAYSSSNAASSAVRSTRRGSGASYQGDGQLEEEVVLAH